ncbi:MULTISPECIES: glycoside hydrolase family 2 protein [Clostridia]|uniref:Beta galactosidase jelly roll domain-containing protein n=1 Tax=Ruminococcus hominis TaxID=2763065 RepID=A0ABR7G5I5_9FIRM|nr:MULTISPECIES: glycoside hydrolase family 2 TIM barrel-domain containing protein [Clostridia]RGH38437.1 glycoside hydrolase family 2 protein [Firmicutes bacterium AM41-5BH]RHT37474.1 glycoside hydrolase family 2 protein [Firmicutes bacterium AM31-12AC]MBC5682684.1 beta galactosidase jelly roll domain-containing protein [Ruminococcus hominis]MCH4280680.1 beta galactosidase jelly roll domain-containing protein [Mediterraneibacter sp. NSJ-151]RKQ27164.1 glycoside hydrolase family 2 protein [Rum
MRNIVSFNDNWKFIKNAADEVEAAKGEGESIALPHTWNAVDGQDGGNDYHRGTCWYVKKFAKPEKNETDKAYLEFCGAAMTAEIYLNGEKISRHEGGYSTFRVEITERLEEENTLVVSVDNSNNTTVYPQTADFTFYGGLYRDVNLIIVPETHFELAYCGSQGIKVTPVVNLEEKKAVVTVEAWVCGDADMVTFEVNQEKINASLEDGRAKAEFVIENVHLWDGVDDPYLYTAKAFMENGDIVSTRFGCRKYYIDPQKGFFLNGHPYLLRGVSRHQDFKGVGNALTIEHHKKDMEIIKEIGATTLRLAHYQHAQEFYDLCDENGLIVWAEIPYITMHMKNGRANTLSQMEELVVQNYNHPSIICWGLSNEITAASAVDDDLLENHRLLNNLCHRLDSTRLTTMANVFMLETDSPILEIPDINSYNLYFGWYLGELEQNDEFFDEYHEKYPDRVIGFSEYGADANPQYQAAVPEKGDYTESYQAVYHEHILQMIEKRPWLWATHVWNLFDFAADGRDEGGKHGENQKGLVTIDRKTKKDAFYLYKAAWNKKEPFVHLCGKRYVDRTEDVTEVKVYSNQSKITLVVDGKEFETQTGKTIFKFNVPISGEHKITAIADSCTDSITVKKVEEENQDYIFIKRSPVTNWFDADELDPECFSINDKLAEIKANPKAGAIIDEMMAKGASDRGDVADAVKDNPGLQRMMGRMTLISLLKQSGADDESIKQVNRILQGIKKEN